MVWQKKTTYAMLTPERRFQIEQEIRARRAACIAAELPPDSSEPEEKEEEEQQPAPIEVEDSKEDEMEQPEEELAPAPGFNMEDIIDISDED
jgi:hypothetical protein